MMATRNLETVTGLVEQINARRTGIKVAGEWLNVSQYHALADLPTPGQRLDVQVEKTDRGAWIQSIDVLDGGQVHPLSMPSRRSGSGGRSPAELREIRRLTCLKAAAAFGASRPDMKSADVLKVADLWVAWVEQPERKGESRPPEGPGPHPPQPIEAGQTRGAAPFFAGRTRRPQPKEITQ